MQTQKFKLGQTVITPGAAALFVSDPDAGIKLLDRHKAGDWGEVPPEDAKLNDRAVANEGDEEKQERVLSAYTVANEKVWVITEWDRSVTTILLPDEY